MPSKAAKAKAAPAKKGAPLVPESVLKKRRKLEEIQTAKAAAAKEKETKAAAKEKDTFKRAEKYIVRSRSRARAKSKRASDARRGARRFRWRFRLDDLMHSHSLVFLHSPRATPLYCHAGRPAAAIAAAVTRLGTVVRTPRGLSQAEYKDSENSAIRMRREAKAAGNVFVADQAKIAFVIRIRGIIGVSPKVRKILQLLRLRQLHNGVFIKLNGATEKMLRLVEPYIAYGYPSLKSVKDLIYKRGFGKVNKQRLPIADNAVIEKALGENDIICVEDLIHEIYTAGPAFKQASNFLWPFKLSSPTGGFSSKLLHFCEGGDAGARGEKINTLIKKMI